MPAMPDMAARRWQAKDGLHIDLRGMSPPEPMVAILATLAQPDETGPVIAHLDRDPIYLYPELVGLGWAWQTLQTDAPDISEACLILTRQR